MLGAIVGDIAGSRFEWNNNKSKDFELLTHIRGCKPTDDTIMSLAIAQAVLDSNPNTVSSWKKTLVIVLQDPFCIQL